MKRRLFLALIPAALATGCGFQLRRLDGIAFATLYVNAPPESPVGQRLLALLRTNKQTRLVDRADAAEAVLTLGREERTKSILSLSGAGRVTEYRLGLNLGYSISIRNAPDAVEPDTIELIRDMTYDDSALLAKGAEEQLLYRDMENSAALRILRRLQALRPGASA